MGAWINEESDGFVVGLDWLHDHFSYFQEEDRPSAMERAFEELDAVFMGQRVVLYELASGNIRWSVHPSDAAKLMAEQPNFYRLERFEI